MVGSGQDRGHQAGRGLSSAIRRRFPANRFDVIPVASSTRLNSILIADAAGLTVREIYLDHIFR